MLLGSAAIRVIALRAHLRPIRPATHQSRRGKHMVRKIFS
jgi:MarR-like DNA-binding transcriptional regulator SgrR of sgrS sRNA